MISVAEATQLVSKNIEKFCTNLETTEVETCAPVREVLAESLEADDFLPPFNRVAMDGIAVASQEINLGLAEFRVEGIQAAGQPQKILSNPKNCLEVMTGAILPKGCDRVIRYEDVGIKNGIAALNNSPEKVLGEPHHIHEKGSDHVKGDVLLKPGTWMTAPQWAIAASIGKTKIKVFLRPTIAIVSTGDELVPIESKPLPHQIRKSNSTGIEAALKDQGFNSFTSHHLIDDKKTLHVELEKLLDKNKVVILSGGVSMGKFDFIPKILSDLKVREVFHKVSQRPGKPLWFGIGESGQAVFGLPGNPISTLVCFRRYVLPSLYQMLGAQTEIPRKLPLSDSVSFKKNLTLFQPVSIEEDGSARPIRTNGSGDFSSLGLSKGFLELPQDKDTFQLGESYEYFPW